MEKERLPARTHPFVARDEHYRRVDELVAANNGYLDRARAAEAKAASLAKANEAAVDMHLAYIDTAVAAEAKLQACLRAAQARIEDLGKRILDLEDELDDACRPRRRYWWQFWLPVVPELKAEGACA